MSMNTSSAFASGGSSTFASTTAASALDKLTATKQKLLLTSLMIFCTHIVHQYGMVKNSGSFLLPSRGSRSRAGAGLAGGGLPGTSLPTSDSTTAAGGKNLQVEAAAAAIASATANGVASAVTTTAQAKTIVGEIQNNVAPGGASAATSTLGGTTAAPGSSSVAATASTTPVPSEQEPPGAAPEMNKPKPPTTATNGDFLNTFWTGNNDKCYRDLLEFCTECERTTPNSPQRKLCCQISNPDSSDQEDRCNIRTAPKSKCNDLAYNHHLHGGVQAIARPSIPQRVSANFRGNNPAVNTARSNPQLSSLRPNRLVPPTQSFSPAFASTGDKQLHDSSGKRVGGAAKPSSRSTTNVIPSSSTAHYAYPRQKQPRGKRLLATEEEAGFQFQLNEDEQEQQGQPDDIIRASSSRSFTSSQKSKNRPPARLHGHLDGNEIFDINTPGAMEFLYSEAFDYNPLRFLAEDLDFSFSADRHDKRSLYNIGDSKTNSTSSTSSRLLQINGAQSFVYGREKFYCLIFLGGRQFLNYNYEEPKPDSNLPKLKIFENFYSKGQLNAAKVSMAQCKEFYSLKGENHLEPDVHVCLDTFKKPLGNFNTKLDQVTCNVISIGIARNWIFEHSVLERGCKVWSFDPTMAVSNTQLGSDPATYQRLPQILSSQTKRHPTRHWFYSVAIGTTMGQGGGGQGGWESTSVYNHRGAGFRYSTVTLRHMIEQIAKLPKDQNLHVLRMDVEGAEVPVLMSWLNDNGIFNRIDQLLMEIHVFKKGPNTDFPAMHKALVSAVGKYMDPFWINKNGHSPAVYEVGFLNRDRFRTGR
ncbi:unnamed protein product [Amoebophrya sp. A120]|nr:unnamed protein product [Amoebophrya sp. A120]|eukprot:GSA120T00025614001.1